MPGWAQAIGEVLPRTHVVRIIRGIMLNGAAWHHVCPQATAIAAFIAVVGAIAMLRYRQTIGWHAGLALHDFLDQGLPGSTAQGRQQQASGERPLPLPCQRSVRAQYGPGHATRQTLDIRPSFRSLTLRVWF